MGPSICGPKSDSGWLKKPDSNLHLWHLWHLWSSPIVQIVQSKWYRTGLRKLPDWFSSTASGGLVRFPWISTQAVAWIDWVQTSTLMASPISSARTSLRRSVDWHCWNWYLQIFVCIFFSLQGCDVLYYLIHLFRMARYHSVAGEVVGKRQACAGSLSKMPRDQACHRRNAESILRRYANGKVVPWKACRAIYL